jgi:hypothetical protein
MYLIELDQTKITMVTSYKGDQIVKEQEQKNIQVRD